MSHGEDNPGPPPIQIDRYAEEISRLEASRYNVKYVDLSFVTIAKSVIGLVPRDIALGNLIIPFREDDGALVVITFDPGDSEKVDKLRFILNRDIGLAVAPRSYFEVALTWYYPETRGTQQGEAAERR